MKKAILIVAFALLSGGCATRPTEHELTIADYGSYPNDYEKIIQNHLQNYWKDPESARYKFLNTPKTGWNRLGMKKYGYVICANINAKNSFGGYTGNRMSYFMIKNGKVIDTVHGDGEYGDGFVQGMCRTFI